MASPAPSGPIQDSASSRIQSPAGSREKFTVRSALRNVQCAKVQHGRGAVAEIRRRHRPHRLRNGCAFHDRPVDAVPDRAGTRHAEPAAGGAQRHPGDERAGGEINGLDARLIRSRQLDRLDRGLRRQFAGLHLDLQHGRADHDDAAGEQPDGAELDLAPLAQAPRSRSSAAPPARDASGRRSRARPASRPASESAPPPTPPAPPAANRAACSGPMAPPHRGW